MRREGVRESMSEYIITMHITVTSIHDATLTSL